MSKTAEILRQMNPGFFDEPQVAMPYACTISAKSSEKDAKGNVTSMKFVQTSDRQIPGITGKSLYLRASFKKAGEQVKVMVNNEERIAFRGSKRSTPGNIFKNQQPNLFNFMVEELKAGNYKPAGKDNDKNDMVEAHALVYGKKIAINVPTYVPQSTDEEGKRKALTGTRYDAEKDEYVTNQEVTMNVFRFFADEDDLDELLSLAVRLVDRQVMPYTKETVTEITQNLAKGTETVKTKEPKASTDEELAAAEAAAKAKEAEQEEEDEDVNV